MTETHSTPAPEQKPVQTKSVLDMNFEEVVALKQYVTDTGKILPRKYTGLSAREQRNFSRKIKQARHNLLAK
jgi:small subunit ribosomal protein S18